MGRDSGFVTKAQFVHSTDSIIASKWFESMIEDHRAQQNSPGQQFGFTF